jgi:CRISPR/Cas system type I-B associated protein Csh2 (Cas7 group RAMP superfamily)
MDNIGMLNAAIEEINALVIQGVVNWKRASSAIDRIKAVVSVLEQEKEAQKKAQEEAMQELRKQREQAKREAAERGEEILGGETINIDLLTGEQTVID